MLDTAPDPLADTARELAYLDAQGGRPQHEARHAPGSQRPAVPALIRRAESGDAPQLPLTALDPAPYSDRLQMNATGRDPRVLVVEDDEEIAQVLQRSLRLEGYEVRVAADGEAALDQSAAFNPDLVILDLGLPKLDGMEVARRLRSADDVPILMLTARDALESRVEGLDAGADDYLVKPFERQELLARLRALLRRRPPRGSASLVVGDLALNPDTHEVSRGTRDIDLTQREFELLEYLMRNERIVVPASACSRRSGATTRSPPRTRSRSSSPTCAASSSPAARRGCCTRSAARGTSCVLERIPIRWRLALLSAGLTLVILSAFAVVIGQATSWRVRSDFNNEEAAAVDDLATASGSRWPTPDGISLVSRTSTSTPAPTRPSSGSRSPRLHPAPDEERAQLRHPPAAHGARGRLSRGDPQARRRGQSQQGRCSP